MGCRLPIDTLLRSVSSLPFLDIRLFGLACSALPCGHMFLRSCLPPLRAVAPCRGLAVSVLATLCIRLSLLVPRRRSYFALRATLLVSASLPHYFTATALPNPSVPRFPSVRHSSATRSVGVLPDIHGVTLPRDYGMGGGEERPHVTPLLVGAHSAIGKTATEKT